MPVAPEAHLAQGTEKRILSGGQERWTDPTVETSMRIPWQDLSVHCCAFVLLENGPGGALLRRAHLVSKWTILAWRWRVGPQGGMAVICSKRGGGHRLAARRLRFRFRDLGQDSCFVGQP
jgi:hypothetical protein